MYNQCKSHRFAVYLPIIYQVHYYFWRLRIMTQQYTTGSITLGYLDYKDSPSQDCVQTVNAAD